MREMSLNDYFVIVLITGFVVLAFLKIGAKEYWASVGESRRAEIAWNMVESKDYLVPKLNGEKIFTKPPSLLLDGGYIIQHYWHKIGRRGQDTFCVGRAWCPCVGFLIARGLYDPLTALLSPAILGTSYLFVHYMRLVELDMTFTFFVTFSFYALLRLRETRVKMDESEEIDEEEDNEKSHLYWGLFFWGSAGLAFMVKGPFALLFPIGAYLALVVFEKETKLNSIKKMFTPWGVLLFFLIASPWFVYVTMYDDAMNVFFGETIERIADNKGRDFPVYYYLTSLANYAPWVLVAPFALLWIVLADRAKSAFVLSWFFVGLLIASIPSAKNYHYILPLYPALAIIVARYIGVHIKRAYGGRIFDGFNDSLAILINLLAIGLIAALKVAPNFTKEVPKLDPILIYFPLALAIILFLNGLIGIVKEKNGPIWVGAISSCYIAFVLAHAVVTPALNNSHSHKSFLLEAKELIPDDAGVLMYKMRNYQVSYYLGRSAKVIYNVEELRASVRGEPATTKPYYIIASQKQSGEVLKVVGGAIALADTFFIPPKKSAEEKRFVLIEKKRKS